MWCTSSSMIQEPTCPASWRQPPEPGRQGKRNRVITAEATSPRSPASISVLMAPHWFDRRSSWPTVRTRPVRRAAGISRSQPSSVGASGFSSRTSLPASS
jgi:hypothetical protein